ncbi:MAG TPA: GIY-YIG nuclease family protein [Candidatus Paceibacterota bacterium]|nr:GIY-YIG nuclease family protein [Candidatus Paceibacterota bacterium]
MSCGVYILKTERGYYIGSTDNLDRRIKQHLSGHTPSTKRMGSIELVFFQKFDNLKEARKIEYKLKRLKRRNYIEKIIKDGIISIG